MSALIQIDRGNAIGLAVAVIAGSLAVGGGAFLGGYVLGERSAPEAAPQTELAEKTYAAEDLEAALAACEIEGVTVEGSSVTLVGADWPSSNRQCFVVEMGAPEIADREYSYAIGPDRLDGAEYSWSNVHMVWEQTDEGRDVTITIK